MMELPTIQPREPHIKDDGLPSSKHSDSPAASTRSIGSLRSGRGSKDKSTADEEIRSDTAARFIEYLEAETGFSSYKAYMDSLKLDPMYAGPFWEDLRIDDFFKKHFDSYSIVDVSMEEPALPKATLRCEDVSAIQAVSRLREPAKGVSVQVVFWSYDRNFGPPRINSEFVNLFGIGLNLDPRFFDSLQLVSSIRIEGVDENGYNLSKYLQVAGTVVAIGRDCPLAKPGAPPIVLMAGSRGFDYHINTKMLYHLRREVPFPQTPDDRDRRVRGNPIGSEDLSLYIDLLSASMKENPGCTRSSEALLFGSLLPLLQIDVSRMRTRYFKVRSWFGILKDRRFPQTDNAFNPGSTPSIDADHVSEGETEKLYQYRLLFRSLMENFEDTVDHLKDFTSSQLTPELSVSPAYCRVVEERRLLLKDALRLDAEIRDYLQLQAGQLSLLESRKSIEVSNNQLEESKRAKIFTILAFIYVPLNLATSIYGMNLQQLNGSGKSLRDFIATAAVALIITGGSWWLIEQMSSLRTWRARDPERYKGPVTTKAYGHSSPNYSILVRVTMLAWLVTNGYWSWMVKSGAGWCALTNSRAGYRARYSAPGQGLTAGDYLSKFIRPGHHFGMFELGIGSWKSSRD